jgi:hypothetical protein
MLRIFGLFGLDAVRLCSNGLSPVVRARKYLGLGAFSGGQGSGRVIGTLR